MQYTTNFGLQKPEPLINNVDIDVINANMNVVDKGLVPYLGTTSGSGNTYTISNTDIKALSEGVPVCVKINTDSTAACTLNINSWGAKAIKKANGANVTNLKSGGMYTMRYDGANFILQGEGASGTATASDLLSGKTAVSDVGEIIGTIPDIGPSVSDIINLTTEGAEYTIAYGRHSGLRKIKAVISNIAASVIKAGAVVGGITGTFTSDATAGDGDVLSGKTYYRNGVKGTGTGVNNGAISQSLPINGSYTIPAGFHNGSGQVTQSITTKGATSYTPGTTDQSIAAGQYLAGAQTIRGDANLIPANIIGTIFNVTGTGKRSASGSVTASSDSLQFNSRGGGSAVLPYISVSGLTFKPSTIWVHYLYNDYLRITVYRGLTYDEIIVLGQALSPSVGQSITAHRVSTVSGPASVTASGFLLPVIEQNWIYNWVAYE